MLPQPVKVINAQVVTTSGQSATLNATGAVLNVEVEVSAVSGTTPSLTLSVVWSNDGTNWAVPTPAQSFSALTTAGNVAAQFPTVADFWALAWTVSGTTPSFTVTAWVA